MWAQTNAKLLTDAYKMKTHQLSINKTSIIAIAISTLVAGCSSFEHKIVEPELGAANAESAPLAGHEKRFHKSVYAATGLGYSWLTPDTSEVSGDVNDRGNNGGQVTIGADINKRFSLELHSADLGSAGISSGGRINYHLHGGSALIYAGKNRHQNKRRGLTGYGRVGMGLLENSPVGNVAFQKDNSNHVLFGAGLEYATKIGVGIRAEVISYEEDVQYGQLGLMYRLGAKHTREAVVVAQAPTPEPVVAAAAPIPEPDPCLQHNGVLNGVTFHTDSARLTTEATTALDGVAETLNNCRDLDITLSGHTDSRASDSYNQSLSERRAQSVLDYLSNQGVTATRMQPIGYGESVPVAPNNTADGRANNRRVELIAK